MCGNNKYGELGFGDTKNRVISQPIETLPPIQYISCGIYFSFFIDLDGVVWCCGINNKGQLGIGEGNYVLAPTPINTLPKIVSVSSSCDHTLFVDYEGSVWASGINENGQLGLGDALQRNQATKIETFPSKICTVSTGLNDSLFLDTNGCVWSCGFNLFGELGVGDHNKRYSPVKITTLPTTKAIGSGYQSSYFLDHSGGVWATGQNNFGQLGLGDTLNRNTPAIIKNLPKIQSISCGAYHVLFLDVEGSVWACGYNKNGQLGIAESAVAVHSPIQTKMKGSAIFSGGYHNICVDNHGFAWCCGFNAHAQLGISNVEDKSSFVNIPNLPKLKIPVESKMSIKQIFYFLEKEQNSRLAQTMINSDFRDQLDKKEFIKQQMLYGDIPMNDWNTVFAPIQKKVQTINELLQARQMQLNEQQNRLEQIQNQIKQTKQGISSLKDEQETLNYFANILENVVEVESELTESYNSKESDPESFTVDDVCLFLKKCCLTQLIDYFQQKKVTGKQLVLLSAASAISELEIGDLLLEKKLEFYCKLLENNLLPGSEALQNSFIWRHLSIDKTITLLAEYEVKLDARVIMEHQISIGQLIYFHIKDIKQFFQLATIEAAAVTSRLLTWKREFENFLSNKQ